MAEGVRDVLGDGAALGVRLRYLEEPEPLGTGGALKFAEDLLDERFFMLNGDVLTDMDLTRPARAARADRRARDARADPGRGSVGVRPRAPARRIARCSEFVEKPGPEQIDTNLINAGAYILEREVLDEMAPAGTNISIEREVFPSLVGRGLFGYEASGYWLDIGTPERYLQGTFDILEGNVTTEVGSALSALGAGPRRRRPDRRARGRAGARRRPTASSRERAIVGGRAVLGRGVEVGAGAHVESSVLLDGRERRRARARSAPRSSAPA